MGNQQGIPEEVKAKFATCELEQMEKGFVELAKLASFRHKHFDKKTFVRVHFPTTPDMGGCIFEAMDRNRTGSVTVEDFFLALSLIIRGTAKEKFKYIFFMITVTCGSGQLRISSNELTKFLTLPFFYPKEMQKKTFEKHVKDSVNVYFQSFDKDKDKFLNLNEFQEWAATSWEITMILDLFLVLEKRFTASNTISGPTNLIHETHVARTEGGGIVMDNIPKAWLQLFREAGVKKKELADPKTCFMLMEIVASKLAEKKLTIPDLPEESSPSVVHQSSPINNNTTPPPSTIVGAPQVVAPHVTNPNPAANTPLAPPAPAPAAASSSKKSATPQPAVVVSSNAPPPPPPPPAAMPAPAPPPPNLLQGKAPMGGENFADMLKNVKMKPAQVEVVDQLSKEDRSDITSALVAAIQIHRVNMHEDDDDNHNDDWDDWD